MSVDLWPLGVFRWQGLVYFVLLLLMICLIWKQDRRPLSRIGLIMVLEWLFIRLVDVEMIGSGGAIGEWILTLGGGPATEQEAVARIALGLALVDFTAAILLLQFVKILTLSRVTAFLFCAMMPAYLLAAVGWMSGGTALDIIFGLGLVQLGLICWTSTSGPQRLAHSLSRNHRNSLLGSRLCALAVGLDKDLAQVPEAARRQR